MANLSRQADCGPHGRPDTARACGPWWCGCPCGQAAPGRCRCRSPPRAGAWRRSGGTCGTRTLGDASLGTPPPTVNPDRTPTRTTGSNTMDKRGPLKPGFPCTMAHGGTRWTAERRARPKESTGAGRWLLMRSMVESSVFSFRAKRGNGVAMSQDSYCITCGTIMTAGSAFCAACGAEAPGPGTYAPVAGRHVAPPNPIGGHWSAGTPQPVLAPSVPGYSDAFAQQHGAWQAGAPQTGVPGFAAPAGVWAGYDALPWYRKSGVLSVLSVLASSRLWELCRCASLF